jgi:hypothetical protein
MRNVLKFGQQTNETPDLVYWVEHVCSGCKNSFYAKGDAWLDKGLCDPCYELRMTALLDFIDRHREFRCMCHWPK